MTAPVGVTGVRKPNMRDFAPAPEFVVASDEQDFTCHICSYPGQDAVRCAKGHMFCRACLQKEATLERHCSLGTRLYTVRRPQIKRTMRTFRWVCPTCRSDKMFHSDRTFGKTVRSKQVHCTQVEETTGRRCLFSNTYAHYLRHRHVYVLSKTAAAKRKRRQERAEAATAQDSPPDCSDTDQDE